MRLFITIKTGYTAGVYGCSGEYFTTILINKAATTAVKWNGMYGAEYRIAEYLKSKGYAEVYASAEYGQLKQRDIHQPTNYSEHAMLKGKLDEMIKSVRGGRK
jgi:hypothetical protein